MDNQDYKITFVSHKIRYGYMIKIYDYYYGENPKEIYEPDTFYELWGYFNYPLIYYDGYLIFNAEDYWKDDAFKFVEKFVNFIYKQHYIKPIIKIQRQLRNSMYDPKYKMCQNIMRKKFEEITEVK